MRSLFSLTVLLTLTLALGVACQQKPTKALSEAPIFPKDSLDAQIKDVFKKDPVLIDARRPFEFGLSRVPGSVQISWQDFTQINSLGQRRLSADYGSWVRRLAVYGVHPSRPVLILADETIEPGAAGRVAWSLWMLGVEQIYIVPIQQFRTLNLNDINPTQNTSIWLPKTKNDLYINSNEWLVLNGQKKLDRIAPKKLGEFSIHQVRDQIVVLNLNPSLAVSRAQFKDVISLNYKELLDPRGMIIWEPLAKKMNGAADYSNWILVVAEDGNRSAFVAWELLRRGYKKVVIVEDGIAD